MHVDLNALDASVFALYLVAVCWLAARACRASGKTRRDYFLAGDSLPWWMVGGSMIAANISSHHFIGVMGVAYNRGFIAMQIAWGAVLIGFNALLWIFLPFYLRHGFYTTPEFLQRRYGGVARTLFAVLVLITYVFVEIAAISNEAVSTGGATKATSVILREFEKYAVLAERRQTKNRKSTL